MPLWNKILFIILYLFPVMVFSQQWFMPSYKAGFAEDTATAILYPAFGEIDLKQGDSSRSYLHRKMFMENFIGLQKEGLVLALNPLMNFYGGTSSRKENIIYRNTRAIQIKGALGKHVAFKTSFYETQMNSPELMVFTGSLVSFLVRPMPKDMERMAMILDQCTVPLQYISRGVKCGWCFAGDMITCLSGRVFAVSSFQILAFPFYTERCICNMAGGNTCILQPACKTLISGM